LRLKCVFSNAGAILCVPRLSGGACPSKNILPPPPKIINRVKHKSSPSHLLLSMSKRPIYTRLLRTEASEARSSSRLGNLDQIDRSNAKLGFVSISQASDGYVPYYQRCLAR